MLSDVLTSKKVMRTGLGSTLTKPNDQNEVNHE